VARPMPIGELEALLANWSTPIPRRQTADLDLP
jgi:hypothetical protein